MTLIVWVKGERGRRSLSALVRAGYRVAAVVTHPGEEKGFRALIKKNTPIHAPSDPNADVFCRRLRALGADVFVLAGYGKILGSRVLEIPKAGAINLHGGKLPDYRGSSPLNWALIRGEKSFTLSVIQVDAGVDTGPVLAERSFRIGPQDTIADLHERANREFPKLLLGVMKKVGRRLPKGRAQKGAGTYFPLRFPEDGFVVWDLDTAQQVHDRIRGLTEPYPCAYTYFRGMKVRLLASEPARMRTIGEPGRVYRVRKDGSMLVAAKDRCLWIRRASWEDGRPLTGRIPRYAEFATVRNSVRAWQESSAKGKNR